MKISIITPVFNEGENIRNYFKAISCLKYNFNSFEVIIVNDGSGDNTPGIIKEITRNSKINFKIINFKKNLGRSMARFLGAKKAKYQNLLFLDSKCEISPNCLRKIKKINYSPINPLILQKKNNIFDLFFYILRRSLYKKNFDKNFSEQFITTKNFDSMAKGMTMFFCDKKLFLDSQPDNIKNKNNSDDTALLANIVKKKNILATSQIYCYYNTRASFIQNIIHIFNRGPKFIDYYYKPAKKHFWLINLIIFFLVTSVYGIINRELSIYGAFIIVFVLDLFLALYITRNLKEFFIFLLLFPVFLLVFLSGLIKGIFIKVFNLIRFDNK